ncbi:MAG: tetratricopeptide repeat protein [Acidobacteriota bacterium]
MIGGLNQADRDRWSSVRVAFAALLVALIVFEFGPPLFSAVVRNRCALEQTRDRAAGCGLNGDSGSGSGPEHRLAFRSALFAGRWERAGQLAAGIMSRPDRLGEALLFREANRRTERGDPAAARAALDAVLDAVPDGGSRDPLVWYSAGQAYEKAGGLSEAEHCYNRGIDAEQGTGWAAGRYYLAVLFYRQGHWSRVIETLEPLAREPIEERIRNSSEDPLTRLADWAGGFLLLGIAQEHLGRTGGAKDLYRRLLAAMAGSGEWKVNRALVSLAALEGRDGEHAEATQHFSRALDLALTYPDAFRDDYQSDTWKQLLASIRAAAGAGQIDRWLAAADAEVAMTPRSAGAWLILALTRAATCQDEAADQALQQAESLDQGMRAFRPRLQAARADLVWTSCRPR